jgi:hypothetical protein
MISGITIFVWVAEGDTDREQTGAGFRLTVDLSGYIEVPGTQLRYTDSRGPRNTALCIRDQYPRISFDLNEHALGNVEAALAQIHDGESELREEGCRRILMVVSPSDARRVLELELKPPPPELSELEPGMLLLIRRKDYKVLRRDTRVAVV